MPIKGFQSTLSIHFEPSNKKEIVEAFSLRTFALTKFVEMVGSIDIIRIFRLAYSHFDRLQHMEAELEKLPLTRSYYFVG